MLFNEDKKVQHPACLSQDSEGPLLLLAIAGTDVHPPLLAGFAVGGSDLVIDRGDAGSAEGIHVNQMALVMPLSLGDLLLSQCSRCSRRTAVSRAFIEIVRTGRRRAAGQR